MSFNCDKIKEFYFGPQTQINLIREVLLPALAQMMSEASSLIEYGQVLTNDKVRRFIFIQNTLPQMICLSGF